MTILDTQFMKITFIYRLWRVCRWIIHHVYSFTVRFFFFFCFLLFFHICIGNLTINGSDNGLSPGRRQAIIWTRVGLLLIGSLGTNFRDILIEMHAFSCKKMHLKIPSGKWQSFCLALNELHWHWSNLEIFPVPVK